MNIDSVNSLPKEVEAQINCGYELIDIVSHEGKYGLAEYDPAEHFFLLVETSVYVFKKSTELVSAPDPSGKMPGKRFSLLTMSVLTS